MSDPKLISPMLDNFIIGDPISDQNGVRCCPAMEKGTDDKYIVKIVSVPASQKQLDALLLSGAYSDKESALDYFSKLSEGIVEEVNALNKLSELEGYLPVEACQIEPMDDGSGFDVYILSRYRKTLQRQIKRGSMTHLSALNLGLDLCSALAVARRLGYLYADLKPSNIYQNGAQEYRIGDIGFLKLNSLIYTSLPDRYHSAYTAPEISDAYSDLNTTIDVYAVGLILYQVFNDGNLPFKGDTPTEEEFPVPAYADYEMAEIIMKACAFDPTNRYQDPVELGQALVGYMQRNGAHDTPIVPVQEPTTDIADAAQQEETATPKSVDFDPNAEIVVTEEDIYTEDQDGNLTFLEDESDETVQEQDGEKVDYKEVTEEVTEILEQVDELIAHNAPDPVVQPEPIDVPVPTIVIEEEPEEVEEIGQQEDDSETTADDSADDSDDDSADEAKEQSFDEVEAEKTEDVSEARPKKKKWVLKTVLIFLAASILTVGIFFYKSFYLQTIDAITLTAGGVDELIVNVFSQLDETDLFVVCTDTYGNQKTSKVVNGQAVFTGLQPNSAYTIKVDTSGFHHLIGNTTTAYTTPEHTEIVQFSAVTGSEDGSAILSFTINGPDSKQWKIAYTAADITEQNIVFSGHMATLTGLEIGKEYTFVLEPVTKLQITGNNTVKHVARTIVKPEHLVVSGCVGNTLTSQWTVRADAEISSWTVRCYNDIFDETIVVAETSASFTIPDARASYTLEVTAAGMSVGERVLVSENSVTVQDFTMDTSTTNEITLSWTPPEEAPNDGWVLQYAVDGSAPKQIPCPSGNSVSVSPIVPGSNYHFVLKTASGEAVLGGTHFYTTPTAENFSGYGVEASEMEFKMCLTPSFPNWDRYDLSKSDYTTEFSNNENASFLVHVTGSYKTSRDIIETLFVIRDENGVVISTETTSSTWTKMWYRSYCELDIPSIPQAPGKYTVTTFFNGAFANESTFTVTE